MAAIEAHVTKPTWPVPITPIFKMLYLRKCLAAGLSTPQARLLA
jgi:hypothetical protein